MIVAFDRRLGTALWNTHLASNQMELTMFGEWAREPLGWVMLEDEGVLYCVTGIGVVAALDARDGRILWLGSYETLPIRPSVGPHPTKRNLVWGINPPVLVDGILYATPRDSRYLLAFDTGFSNGSLLAAPSRGATVPGFPKLLWRFGHPNIVREFLGYHAGRLYLTGARRIVALDVDTDFPARLPQRLPDRIAWTRRERISGRPALTDQGIVFTDATGLRLVDYELTTVRDLTSEPFRKSDYGTYSGNVVVYDDRILVMSRDLLTSFVPRRAVAPANEKGGTVPPRSPEDI